MCDYKQVVRKAAKNKVLSESLRKYKTAVSFNYDEDLSEKTVTDYSESDH